MKNLFDYATKELSQDAFLAWLFDNYQDDKIGHISKELLSSMINLYENVNPDDITDIEIHTQAQKIDIVVDFKLKNKPAIICIEDKTTSNQHSNQLKRYKDMVENNWNIGDKKERKSFFIYYKTHAIESSEEDEIKDAAWKKFSFEKINKFWKEYQEDDNLLISMYAKHVVKGYNDSINTNLPKTNNVNQWYGFFKNTIEPKIKIEGYDTWVGMSYYGYSYFCVGPSSPNNRLPYLEIRSRDCYGGEFARILMYGRDMKYLIDIRNIIKSKESNNIFKGNYGNKHNKQVAHTIKGKYSINTEEDFIKATNEVIKAYLEIMNDLLKNDNHR